MDKYKLSELIKIKNGCDYKKLNNGTVPVYGTGGIMTYVDKWLYDGESVLLPRKGSLDNILYVNGKFWTVDTMYWTEINTEKVYPRYLYYYLSLLDLSCRDTGSTLPSMTFDAYYELEVMLPNKEEQKKVLDILVPIEEKVKANSQINDNLEQQIRLLYEFWFVQFNFPDSKGNPYRLSNGKMQWNDDLKSLIPEEWHCKQIIELASIDNESLNPSNFGTQLMEHYSIPAFDETHCPRFESANTIESNKYVVNKKAILVSKLNPQFKRIWDPFCETKNAICSTEFIAYIPYKEEERSFLYAVLDSDAFYTHSVQRATSSTGSRKRIQPEVSASFKFAYPNNENIIKDFCNLCTPILKKKKDLLKENQDLRALKDWLLPFIMNGQFSISD